MFWFVFNREAELSGGLSSKVAESLGASAGLMETPASSMGPAEGWQGSSDRENISFGMYNECSVATVDLLVTLEREEI